MSAARSLPIPGRAPSARTFILCPWTTIRGNSATVTSIVQDRRDWLDLDGYADATFVIEVSEVTNPTGATVGYVLLVLESSPTPDESAFKPVAGPIPCTVTSTPVILKTASAGAYPLARYLRWRIFSTGPGTTFDATFRIRVAAQRQFYFAPTMLGGCQFWVRADLGLSFTNQTVTGWLDQSGNNDPNRNLNAGSSPPTLNLVDPVYGNQPSMAFSGNSNCYFLSNGATANGWTANYSQPKTWVFVGHQTATSSTYYLFDGGTGVGGDTAYIDSTGVIHASSGSSFITSPSGFYWTGSVATTFMFESLNPSGNAYLNSFSARYGAGTDGTNVTNSISLGVHSIYWGGGSAWVGTISEAMFFSGTLSTSSKALLRSYLNNRYGLAIT